MKVERRALEDINAGLVSDRRVLFSQAVFDVVNHRSLEEYNGVVSEGGIKVVERAVTVTDTTDAASMVPVTIGEIIEPLEKGLIIDKLGIQDAKRACRWTLFSQHWRPVKQQFRVKTLRLLIPN